jgi:hypothetical protein
MKSKLLLRAIVLLTVLFGTFGSAPLVGAAPDVQTPTPEVVVRELTYWNATYMGYVDPSRYEKWPFVFGETHDFTVTVNPTSGDLVPLVVLLDGSDNEITSGQGSISSTQPAGSYAIQVQPVSGGGNYELMIREIVNQDQSVSTELTDDTITEGESTTVTVNLNNVPPEGYTSAEFTCTYPPSLVEVSNIVVTNLFGTDPAVAIFGPQNGNLIVAIAGSNGQKATNSGAAFSFDVTGLQAGQAVIECNVRVSTGNDVLIDLPSISSTLTINEVVVDGTLTGQVLASKTVTINLYNPDNSLATSLQANTDGTFSLTAPAGTYTVGATASGFLDALGPAVITAGQTTTKATISLLAGDIDGNDVIDQYDAMTIGMSYNTATPDAADLNADGIINVLDLELLAANYRASGALDWQ